MPWPEVVRWCRTEELRLLAFPRASVTAIGEAVVLDARGEDSGDRAPTYLTARMAHVQALATMRGHPSSGGMAAALLENLGRSGADGWTDEPAGRGRRSIYALSFVILAASTGSVAGIHGAPALLEGALARLEQAFWEPSTDRPVDRLDEEGHPLPYRGMNGAMHLTEALFAAADATGDAGLEARAVGLCRFVLDEAATRSWRILEHYDEHWRPMPDHHRSEPDDAFRPYGSTVGHGFEWARLIAQAADLGSPTDGLADGAAALYRRAVTDGWARTRSEGFVYTVDWDGTPVSRRRLHWVAAEAFAAASVLARLPGDPAAAGPDVTRWQAHIRSSFVDERLGSWTHELDVPAGAPKPDLYHAYQAVLIPQVPVATSLAAAVRAPEAPTGGSVPPPNPRMPG
jgi:sulfoquinovose isomerase